MKAALGVRRVVPLRVAVVFLAVVRVQHRADVLVEPVALVAVPFRAAVVLPVRRAVDEVAALFVVDLVVLLAVADETVLPAAEDLVDLPAVVDLPVDRLAVADVVVFLRVVVVVLVPVVERVVLDRAVPVLLVVRFAALVGIGLAPGKESISSHAALLYRAVPRGTLHNGRLL